MARVKQGQSTRLMPGTMGTSFPSWHLLRSLWPVAVTSCQGDGSQGHGGKCRGLEADPDHSIPLPGANSLAPGTQAPGGEPEAP